MVITCGSKALKQLLPNSRTSFPAERRRRIRRYSSLHCVHIDARLLAPFVEIVALEAQRTGGLSDVILMGACSNLPMGRAPALVKAPFSCPNTSGGDFVERGGSSLLLLRQ